MSASTLTVAPHLGSGSAGSLVHVALVCIVAAAVLVGWLVVRRSRRDRR